ncbi:MAG: hypothetical protein FWD51_00065 [Betaproteobacteria bacterium]|nr:hypothetical protein [Betaproteobacteria bacterium]
MSLLQQKLRQPAKCAIKIDGREIDGLYPYLEQVSVETSRKDAAICTLTFASVRDEFGTWNVQDAGLLEPWRRILIEAVFGTDSEEIMRGFIRDIKIEYPDDMNVNVVVTAQDESILLDRNHVRKNYSTLEEPLRDDTLIKELLKPHWVGSDVEVSAGMTCGDLLFDGTPIKLIKNRAALNGFEFLIRNGKAYFGPPNLAGTPQPVILIYAGPASNCFNFSVHHDGHRPDGVCVSEAPETSSEVNSGKSYFSDSQLLGLTPANSKGKGLNDFIWYIKGLLGSTSAEREACAKAIAEEIAWKISATGKLDGSVYGHVLQTSRTVKVDGVGSTYGGLWYVDEVKHLFSIDGYYQEFQLIRNATGDADSSGKLDPLAGVRQR